MLRGAESVLSASPRYEHEHREDSINTNSQPEGQKHSENMSSDQQQTADKCRTRVGEKRKHGYNPAVWLSGGRRGSGGRSEGGALPYYSRGEGRNPNTTSMVVGRVIM